VRAKGGAEVVLPDLGLVQRPAVVLVLADVEPLLMLFAWRLMAPVR
jgi:hypothetical protein